MKNQYFGDIVDYGKYSLLRFLDERGILLAVNWYLTADVSDDEKRISYLEDNSFFKYDSGLFVFLKENVIMQKKRSVSLLEDSNLLQDVVYYDDMMADPEEFVKKEREEIRTNWHEAGVKKCGGKDLVFLNPDNGFREKPPKKIADHAKYCYANEVLDYYNSGSNVVYVTFRGRRTDMQWESLKKSMCKATPDAKMFGLNFHKETNMSYIFAIHPKDAERYGILLDTFLNTNWKDMFSVEKIG